MIMPMGICEGKMTQWQHLDSWDLELLDSGGHFVSIPRPQNDLTVNPFFFKLENIRSNNFCFFFRLAKIGKGRQI
jgi:hypothetical protein